MNFCKDCRHCEPCDTYPKSTYGSIEFAVCGKSRGESERNPMSGRLELGNGRLCLEMRTGDKAEDCPDFEAKPSWWQGFWTWPWDPDCSHYLTKEQKLAGGGGVNPPPTTPRPEGLPGAHRKP